MYFFVDGPESFDITDPESLTTVGFGFLPNQV